MAKVVRWLSRALLVVFAQVALAALIGVLYQNISLTAPGCIRAHDNITSNLPMIIVGVTNPAGCSEAAIQSESVTTPDLSGAVSEARVGKKRSVARSVCAFDTAT